MIAQEMMTTEVNQEYVIIVPRDATETEYYAADELSDYIFKINGVQLSVHTEDQIRQEKEIVIGDTDRDPQAEEPELYNDGYWLLEEDDKIYIQGDNDRGVLYGVYGFLEDVLGCRFYTSMVEYVPQRSTLTPVGLRWPIRYIMMGSGRIICRGSYCMSARSGFPSGLSSSRKISFAVI